MKANQKFMEADNAVSPVIGVILMVAITVVLAAVVFVLVSDLGGGSGQSQPAIAWSVSQADNTASVTSADPGADWSEFEFRLSELGEFEIVGAPDCATNNPGVDLECAAAADTWVQLDTGGAIGGGDTIEVCLDVAGPATLTLRHIDSNSIARAFDFNNVAACPT